jgi:hypothetical protein
MIFRGACHCGAVRAEFETAEKPRLRFDGCSFCASRGVKSASDAKGVLRLWSEHPLTRYRFGHATADYLICPGCGTYVATQMDGPEGPVGVVNVVGLQIPELKDEPADFASLEGESVEARITRRLTRWTPMVLVEPEERP